MADTKRLAKATAAAEEKKRKEDEQVAKEAAYNQAMLNNNAGHLITNPFSLSDNAPPWLTELVVYLPEQDLGSEWRGCIQAFVTLHVNMGCADMVSHNYQQITAACLPEGYRSKFLDVPTGPRPLASGSNVHANWTSRPPSTQPRTLSSGPSGGAASNCHGARAMACCLPCSTFATKVNRVPYATAAGTD